MPLFTRTWVKKNIGSFATLVHRDFPNVPEHYDYSEKNRVRRYMVKQTSASLDPKSKRIRMLFMPSVWAIDLYEFSQKFRIDSAHSLAVEHNHFYAEHLRSWVEAADQLVGGVPFKGMQIYEGKMSEATREVSGPFEVANLDFISPWNREVRESVKNLLQRDLLTIPAVLFITLNATDWIRSIHEKKTDKSLAQLMPARIYRLSHKTKYTCHYRWHMDWIGEGGSKMLTIAFTVHAKEKRVES